MKSTRRLLVGALVAAMLASGCGGDDDGSNDGAGGSPSDTTAALSGDPISLGVIAIGEGMTPPSPYLGNIEDGAKAAAEALNDDGGLEGRPIEIISCDTRADPNVAAECARDMVAKGVVAIIGSYSSESASWMPITEAAGIPSIGHVVGGPADLADTVKLTYPLVAGLPGIVVGQGVFAGESGAKKPSIVRNDAPTTAQAAGLVGLGLKASGLEVNNEVAFPFGAPDLSSFVAQATRGDTDVIIAVLSPQDLVNFVRALRQSGSDIPVVAPNQSLTLGIDSGFAADLEGVNGVGYLMPPTGTDDPEVKQFRDELDALSSDAEPDELAANAWISVHLFADVAKDLPKVDSAAVVRALNELSDYDAPLIPPVDFTTPLTVFPGARLFMKSVIFTVVKDGEIAAVDGKFVDVL